MEIERWGYYVDMRLINCRYYFSYNKLKIVIRANMLSFLPKNPSEIQDELKAKFRAKRKALKLTQEELSIKSGVSLGSLKRFESSSQISLESLLKLAFVLECLGDFQKVCQQREEMPTSIEDLL